MNLAAVIKRPLITEKATWLTGENKYTFQVARLSTKTEIKGAVEKYFGVKVKKVKTLMMRGKKRRLGKTRRLVKGGDWKKAVVILKAGEKIDLFPKAEEEKS
jgi:large subunit ribosomal protein L23